MPAYDQDGFDELPAWEDMDPLQQATLESSIEDLEEARAKDLCPHCGKDYEDFSDMGCGHCDRRSPYWGILP